SFINGQPPATVSSSASVSRLRKLSLSSVTSCMDPESYSANSDDNASFYSAEDTLSEPDLDIFDSRSTKSFTCNEEDVKGAGAMTIDKECGGGGGDDNPINRAVVNVSPVLAQASDEDAAIGMSNAGGRPDHLSTASPPRPQWLPMGVRSRASSATVSTNTPTTATSSHYSLSSNTLLRPTDISRDGRLPRNLRPSSWFHLIVRYRDIDDGESTPDYLRESQPILMPLSSTHSHERYGGGNDGALARPSTVHDNVDDSGYSNDPLDRVAMGCSRAASSDVIGGHYEYSKRDGGAGTVGYAVADMPHHRHGQLGQPHLYTTFNSARPDAPAPRTTSSRGRRFSCIDPFFYGNQWHQLGNKPQPRQQQQQQQQQQCRQDRPDTEANLSAVASDVTSGRERANADPVSTEPPAAEDAIVRARAADTWESKFRQNQQQQQQ
ncbi:hypothetical protein EV182_001607, partial [Spiromyces aspiralis]